MCMKTVKHFHRSLLSSHEDMPWKKNHLQKAHGVSPCTSCDGRFERLIPSFFTFCKYLYRQNGYQEAYFSWLVTAPQKKIFSFQLLLCLRRWYLNPSFALGIERGLFQWTLLVTEWSLTINTDKWYPKQRGFHCEHHNPYLLRNFCLQFRKDKIQTHPTECVNMNTVHLYTHFL